MVISIVISAKNLSPQLRNRETDKALSINLHGWCLQLTQPKSQGAIASSSYSKKIPNPTFLNSSKRDLQQLDWSFLSFYCSTWFVFRFEGVSASFASQEKMLFFATCLFISLAYNVKDLYCGTKLGQLLFSGRKLSSKRLDYIAKRITSEQKKFVWRKTARTFVKG